MCPSIIIQNCRGIDGRGRRSKEGGQSLGGEGGDVWGSGCRAMSLKLSWGAGSCGGVKDAMFRTKRAMDQGRWDIPILGRSEFYTGITHRSTQALWLSCSYFLPIKNMYLLFNTILTYPSRVGQKQPQPNANRCRPISWVHSGPLV